jgi:hypothetical protein
MGNLQQILPKRTKYHKAGHHSSPLECHAHERRAGQNSGSAATVVWKHLVGGGLLRRINFSNTSRVSATGSPSPASPRAARTGLAYTSLAERGPELAQLDHAAAINVELVEGQAERGPPREGGPRNCGADELLERDQAPTASVHTQTRTPPLPPPATDPSPPGDRSRVRTR